MMKKMFRTYEFWRMFVVVAILFILVLIGKTILVEQEKPEINDVLYSGVPPTKPATDWAELPSWEYPNYFGLWANRCPAVYDKAGKFLKANDRFTTHDAQRFDEECKVNRN